MRFAQIFIFLLSLTNVISQSDNVEEEYFEQALRFVSKKSDSLFHYTELLKKSSNSCLKYYAHTLEAKFFYDKFEYDKSRERLFEIISKLNGLEPDTSYQNLSKINAPTFSECILKLKIDIYRRLFYIEKNQANLDDAFEHLVTRRNLLEELPGKNRYYFRNLAGVDRSMALIKINLELYEDARPLLHSAEENLLELSLDSLSPNYSNMLKERTNLYNTLGDLYLILHTRIDSTRSYADSAKVYFDKAYASNVLSEGGSSNDFIDRSLYIRLSRVSTAKREYANSVKLLSNAQSLIDNPTKMLDIHYGKAVSYYHLGNLDSSLFHGKEFISTDLPQSLYKERMLIIYDLMAKAHYNLKEIDSAYKYSQLTLDSLNTLSKVKKKTLKLLNEDDFNEIQELNNKIIDDQSRLKRVLFVVVTGAFLAMIFLTTIFVRKRKLQTERYRLLKQRYKELLEVKAINKATDYKINDNLERNVLLELKKIEDSDIFTSANFNLYTLSKLLKTNTSYLSRIINAHKKKTFKQYLSELRIEFLITKLDEEPLVRKYTVKALAEEIGYTNASAFTRAFKNHTRVSPSEYIRQKYS